VSFATDIASWYDQIGPALFVAVVWGLVFAGTGLLIGAFVPFITGDSLVFASGIVAANFPESINIWALAIGIVIFAWLGDQVGYTLGRHYGRPYLDKREGLVLKKAISNAEKFYNAWGWWAVVVARFVPFARALVPVLAGIGRMNYYKFFSANLVGAVLWGFGLSMAGYYAATLPAVKNISYFLAVFFIAASLAAGIRAWYKNNKSIKIAPLTKSL
jgi:membrane-associated protein